MIKRILLKGIATYQEQVEINNLRKINFFYGSNGSGKTVLSKVIANPDKYSICEVEWENKLKTVVFNEDFVSSVFTNLIFSRYIYNRRRSNRYRKSNKNEKEEKHRLKMAKKSRYYIKTKMKI